MRKLLSLVFVFVSVYVNSQTMCGGSSATLQAPNPQNLSNPNYTLLPGPFTSTSGVFVVSPPATTNYTFLTQGTGTAGVVTTTAVTTLTVFPKPLANPSFTQASCTNTTNVFNLGLTFNPPSPVPSYTILWNPLPGGILTPQQTTASASAPGPYTAVITAAGGCSVTLFFTMTPAPAPAIYTVIPFGNTHSITCTQTTVILNTNNANLTYTWSSTTSTPIVSPSITLTAANVGTLSVVGTETTSGCTATYTFALVQNVSSASSTIVPLLQNITCSQTAVSTVSVYANPTVNISHFIYAPQGGTFAANSHTAIYTVGGTGTFTHCLVNDESGCSTCKTFTVTSNQGFPTFTVTSPQSFTLGCNTKSVATIDIVNASATGTDQVPNGGPVSYTLLAPGASSATPPGTLSGISSYTVNVPGTWTVVTKDNASFCETRIPISVLQKTAAPHVSAVVPRQVLNCTDSTVILEGVSQTPNVGYNWTFPTTPGNVNGSTLTVLADMATRTKTLVAHYTLTITDNINTCKSTSIIPIYQNIFLPLTGISNGGISSLSCNVPTIVLTNTSTSGITTSFFPKILPVIGYEWFGPSPQQPLQVSSTYVAATVGTYTLVGKDLNNGCRAVATITIGDNKIVPVISNTATPSIIDCAAKSGSLIPSYIGATNYTWTGPPTASLSSQNAASQFPNVPGTYTVVATNSVNGCSNRATMTLVSGALTGLFEMDKTSGYAPLTVNFTNKSFSSNNSSSITSVWSFGNDTGIVASGNGVSVSPSIVYKQPGTYTVVLFVSKGACLDTTTGVIEVEIPSQLVVPNVFTPNADGINDFFFLKSTNLSEINISIYDRWGHVVYELTSDKGNIEWDGLNQYGKESAEGTYFYVLTATGKDGKTYDQKGTVNLYR